MSLLERIYRHDKFLPVFAVIAIGSFVIATFALSQALAQDRRREADRIAADIHTCERVNILRGQVVDGFIATELAFDRTFDVFFPDTPSGEVARDARVTEIRRQIDPILAELHTTLEGVEFTDCEAVTPGGKP